MSPRRKPMAQEVAPGREYTVDVYVDRQGRCRCTVPRLRIETRGGEVVKGMTVRCGPIEDLCRRVAEALGESVGSLFEGPAVGGTVVRMGERRRLVHPQRQWEDVLLTPGDAKHLQVILSTIEAGGGSGEEAYSHDSDEECVMVLKGQLEFWIEDESFLLEEGDSLLFESRRPHRNRNPGPGKAEVLWVITPPSY
jgi:quercetin dioxygenase-like cupin family protein